MDSFEQVISTTQFCNQTEVFALLVLNNVSPPQAMNVCCFEHEIDHQGHNKFIKWIANGLT